MVSIPRTYSLKMVSVQFAALLTVIFLYGSIADDTNIHTDFVSPNNGSLAVENNHNDEIEAPSSVSCKGSDSCDGNNDTGVKGNNSGQTGGINIGKRELSFTVSFKAQLADKFLFDVKNAYEAFHNFLSKNGNNTNNSVEVDRFTNTLNSFFDQFQNVTFTSINQIASAFNRGANYLQNAITRGRKLHHDAVARGNYAMASRISGLLRGLRGLLTLGKGLNLYVSISAGVDGGFETGSTVSSTLE